MTAPTAVELDPDTQARVERLAEAQHRPAEGVVREAVEQYVEREEARERLRRDVLAFWAEYEAMGLHLTGDEVNAWLTRLEAGEEVDPPECHV